MKKSTAYFFIAACILLSSCDLLNEKIEYEHTYTYGYSANTDITYAGGSFSEIGGMVNTLSGEEDFLLNGTEPYSSSTFENYLGQEFTGEVDEMEFLFVDSRGKEHVNTFHLHDLPEISIDNSMPLNNTEEWHAEWTGEPVGFHEQVSIRIMKSYFDIVYESTLDTPGETEFIVPANRMDDIYSWDDIDVVLTRRRTVDLQSDLTGTITTYYESPAFTFEVE